MPKKLVYVYNKNTCRLHIKGFCCHATLDGDIRIPFNNETEVYEKVGHSVVWCKICRKKIDAELRNNK